MQTNHFLLLKKFKNTESAQRWFLIRQHKAACTVQATYSPVYYRVRFVKIPNS